MANARTRMHAQQFDLITIECLPQDKIDGLEASILTTGKQLKILLKVCSKRVEGKSKVQS